jgi:hypothetical protein
MEINGMRKVFYIIDNCLAQWSSHSAIQEIHHPLQNPKGHSHVHKSLLVLQIYSANYYVCYVDIFFTSLLHHYHLNISCVQQVQFNNAHKMG